MCDLNVYVHKSVFTKFICIHMNNSNHAPNHKRKPVSAGILYPATFKLCKKKLCKFILFLNPFKLKVYFISAKLRKKISAE